MTTIVLFGGLIDERHVSVASAQMIAAALDQPLCWFWAPNGAVHDVALSNLLAHERPFEIDFIPTRPAIFPDIEQTLDTVPVDDPVFLLALHGGAGEDGTLQRLLEARGLPFTGSSSEACTVAFDKAAAKACVAGQMKTAESRVGTDPLRLREMVDDLLSRYRKIVLKPLAGGSSRGLHFLAPGDDLGAVIAGIRIPYLIEQFVDGRELTVGVIDRGDGPRVLPVLEIEVDPGQTFDYGGKYLGKGTREICPANIPDWIRDEVQRAALAVHVALGCVGYSRSDFVATEDGLYFLELNTLPGLTRSSLLPQQLRAAGIGFRTFLDEQLQLARRRKEQPYRH